MKRKEVYLAIGSVLVAFGAAEAAARIFLPAPFRSGEEPVIHRVRLHRSDPRIGWVLSETPVRVPHRLADAQGNVQYDVTYTVAAGQRRTSENPPEAPPVIATGCSFTFGHGLNDQDTWPWLLQQRSPRYRVMNVATMGYGTDQALLAAERQVDRSRRKPQAVVLGFADFQIERNRSPQGWMVHVYPFSKPLFEMVGTGIAYQRQVRFWPLGPLGHSDLLAHAANTLANRAYGIPSHEQARDLTVALITAFARRFESDRVRLAVVILPYVADTEPQAKLDTAFVVEHLRAAGIPVLVPEFPRLPGGYFDFKRYLLSPIDRHPNRQYNLELTDQLEPFLSSVLPAQ